MSSVHSEKGFDLKFGDEDLLVDGAEHVLVAAQDGLGHQVVDPGLDPACVVTLVIIFILKLQLQWEQWEKKDGGK